MSLFGAISIAVQPTPFVKLIVLLDCKVGVALYSVKYKLEAVELLKIAFPLFKNPTLKTNSKAGFVIEEIKVPLEE